MALVQETTETCTVQVSALTVDEAGVIAEVNRYLSANLLDGYDCRCTGLTTHPEQRLVELRLELQSSGRTPDELFEYDQDFLAFCEALSGQMSGLTVKQNRHERNRMIDLLRQLN